MKSNFWRAGICLQLKTEPTMVRVSFTKEVLRFFPSFRMFGTFYGTVRAIIWRTDER